MSSALKGQRKAPQPQRSASVASAWRLAAALLAQPPEALLDSRRRRALLRLGQGFERARAWWPALRCFCASGLPPATERRLRMLWRLGQQPAARAIAYQLLTPEQRALDRAFGQSLLRHGIRRRNSRSSEVRVSLLETPNRRPIEQQALELLLNAVATTSESGPARGDDPQPAAQPPIGWHCENLFSLGLAGLIYWPIIYAPIKGAFTRRFQSRPHGFGEPGFLQERQPQLAALERQWLRNGEPLAGCAEALTDHLLAQQQNNAGILNPLVSWQFWTAERLVRLLRQVDPLQLLKLARFTIHNLTDYRTGFPDLVICSGDGSFFCVEVKGPNDTLQPMQRQWLQALRTLDIEAFVLKVESSGRL
jgi:hypothetical protein